MSPQYAVKNTFNFSEEVVKYDQNIYMSLNVDSLFTNIPLE